MLEKAVAVVKADKTKALDIFNRGEGAFKDRDLYVFYANRPCTFFAARWSASGSDHQTLDLDFVKLCHWNKAMKLFSAPTKPF
jgi:hypothetical protein